ncbi:transglycosylase-like protein with SLT domain [Salsuginibacillus halophilus]|uniref:Transglycosylase-like protein with SLT domain n=1 Tax=Salsuginibacillus halophilus TaxID=517424 RepID=A0A2P8HFM0_9BACI|nr:lytic transglycosylase domain-containing protein [Salsuginibacillus halophilus]PSL45001.1 transglycosylase-like protein with SLT domain [Salsuginibacillus halophilus]
MTARWLVLLLTAFLMLTGFEQEQLEDRIQALEEKEEELNDAEVWETEDLEAITFDRDLEDMSYHEWMDAQETAAYFHEESEGDFKEDWSLFLVTKALEKDIDPHIVYELLRIETGDTFDPDLVGPETQYGHAYGLGQFMKNTAPWMAEKAGLPYEHSLLYNPYYSMELTVTYLDYLYEEYGDWDNALTAYHRGKGGLAAYKEENGTARSWYAEDIQVEAAEQKELAARGD